MKDGIGLSRRELLRLLGQAGTTAAGIAILGTCKGTPTSPGPEPPKPVHSTVLVRFYNHTQGYLGEKTYNGTSDSLLPVKAGDCPDVSTVDMNRIAVREAAEGGWLGRRIEYSSTGQLKSTKFPTQDSEYDAFLMNKTNGADYGLIEDNDGLPHSPNATWDREDWYATGPDEIPHEAIRQIREVLVFPWAKYLELTELPPDIRGNFYVGYRVAPDAPEFRGSWGESAAWVNPEVCGDDVLRLRVFIEMITGHLISKMGFGYNSTVPPTYEYITDNNGINEIGKDLLACSIVRDRRHA